MTYVVTKPCLGTKDRSCVEVCPVDCFFDVRKKKLNGQFGIDAEGDDGAPAVGMLMIHPDQCINCGACETECPVEAIYEDASVPANYAEFTKLAEDLFAELSDKELAEINCTEKLN
jgi:ferredoxin